MSPPATPRLCPLCHRSNRCDTLAGAARCWCHEVVVPTALLARVPTTARGAACICRDCIESFARENPPPSGAIDAASS